MKPVDSNRVKCCVISNYYWQLVNMLSQDKIFNKTYQGRATSTINYENYYFIKWPLQLLYAFKIV